MNAPVTKDAERVIELSNDSFSRRDEAALPAVQSAGNAGSLLQAIERVASNPSMDIAKIERLFAMHQQLMAKEAEAAFNDAMARAQAKIVPVVANQTNTHTQSMYADLAAISKVITPLFTAEGLSISFDADRPILGADGKPLPPPPQGWFRTIAIVSHAVGHSRLHHIDLPSDEVGVKGNTNKTPIQGVVSMTTYGRRVLTCMVFNVAIGDEDGNGGGETRQSVDMPRTKTKQDNSPLSDGERNHIKNKMEHAALTEIDLKAKFGKTLAELTNDDFAAAKAWISNPSA